MRTRDVWIATVGGLLAVSFIIMLHQFVNWDTWWTWSDMLHHENFALGLSCVALGMCIAACYLIMRNRARKLGATDESRRGRYEPR